MFHCIGSVWMIVVILRWRNEKVMLYFHDFNDTFDQESD